MDIESKYTDIDVETLVKSADITTSYGQIRIDEITENLQRIDIESSYADIRIYNPNDVGFEFDIQTEHGSILVDEGNGDFGDDDEDHWAKGKRKGSGNGRIEIDSRHGSVKIR